jgi:hypothetical protein
MSANNRKNQPSMVGYADACNMFKLLPKSERLTLDCLRKIFKTGTV